MNSSRRFKMWRVLEKSKADARKIQIDTIRSEVS
jgi:hypothetical protein